MECKERKFKFERHRIKCAPDQFLRDDAASRFLSDSETKGIRRADVILRKLEKIFDEMEIDFSDAIILLLICI